MEEKKISIEKINAVLSMASMALLAIQHFVGLLAKNVSISYLPLSVTFLMIFISTMDAKKTKEIKRISLTATALVALTGCVIYTIRNYGITINENLYNIYLKIMLVCIGVLSLLLSIFYVKQIAELE